ncbi:peptidoglycan editing factor PgeF [Candidatus Gottesmanbacteria bacterium]|nr:peptidoglycan editing factor PgeF [Candidatus Gottesmanbacteria bacterium]
MKKNMDNRKKFISQLGISTLPRMAQQMHGANVAIATDKSSSYTTSVDGLVTNVPVALGVVTADCVPMLCVDPKTHVVAAVHAGWKGTIGKIAAAAVAQMKYLSAKPEDILVAIGPHIGMCCYDIPDDRAGSFAKELLFSHRVCHRFEDGWHLDIGFANYLQLIACGVLPEHIDAPITCTSCQNDKFFSYRKDTQETYGEMLAAIAFNE